MCSGSDAGSYLRLIDVVYHSTLGLRVIKKKKKNAGTERWHRHLRPKRPVSNPCRAILVKQYVKFLGLTV